VLRGGKGGDYLYADSGADTLLGGAGFDVVSYGSRTRPVTVDLDGSKRDDGERGEKDTVGADVEGIVGGAGADRLTGNAADNRIVGGAGDDGLVGGAGNDTLIGQAGNDSISGGPGSDYLVGESPNDNNHVAKDHMDGGWDGPYGDTCIGAILATMVRCEHFG
jgi:Ca2+-binding RTX toxin-like protein